MMNVDSKVKAYEEKIKQRDSEISSLKKKLANMPDNELMELDSGIT